MRELINKDNPLIKDYIELRSKVIKWFDDSPDDKSDNYYKNQMDTILDEGKFEWLVNGMDEAITKSKLSDRCSSLFEGSSKLELMENDFILVNVYGHDKNYSFKTKKECVSKSKEIKKDSIFDDYEPLKNDYKIIKMKPRKGTLDDNYNWIIKKHNKGYSIFIKGSSIYSDNIIISCEKI